MAKIVATLSAIILATMLIFFGVLVGTLMGALSGWIVGLFFADTILTFFSYIFGTSHGFQMWEIGASLGFLGGFFRTSVSSS